MRSARFAAVCAAVSLTAVGFAAPAAVAQDSPPTTPIPEPADPGQPPASQPNNAPGPVVAEAGTMIGILRILPRTVPGDSIVEDPEFNDQLPKQSVAEIGLGRAVARANSTAFFAHERSTAEASPVGASLFGKTPTPPVPGAVAQAAVPDHPEPETSELKPPENPGDRLLNITGSTGRAQARWDEQRGPCVSPISDAHTSLGGASAINALPNSRGNDGEELLGGLLDGQQTSPDGTGSLTTRPNLSSAHSTVDLVAGGPQPGKAVRSTSRLQLSSLRLFPGTPQEVRVEVAASPELSATSTGDPKTSSVNYEAPVLRVLRNGEEWGQLDAHNPVLEMPIGAERNGRPPLDLGLLRMSIGELRHSPTDDGVRASASLFDVDVLPGAPVGAEGSLARLTIGEQAVRAGAPQGGVRCDGSAAATGGDTSGSGSAPVEPASTGPAGHASAAGPPAGTGEHRTVPLFWAAAGSLLLGSILVAVLPRYRRQR